MSGPPPKPTALKVIEGNRGKQKLNTKEPKPRPVHKSKMPMWLSKYARQFWRRYVTRLGRLGLYTEIDEPAMALLAEEYADLRECLAVVQADGRTFLTDKGYVVQRPEVAILRKARKDMESLLAHFGMTPAARSRLMVDLDEEMNDFERLLD